MLYDLESPVEARTQRSLTHDRDSVVGEGTSGTRHSKARRKLGGLMTSKDSNKNNNKRTPLDDTDTGGEGHVASKDFLRLVRVMTFLGPRRGKSTTVGDARSGGGWKPRSELDVSGHSFRRGIKAEVRRIKSVHSVNCTNNNHAAKEHLQRLRSPTQSLRPAYHGSTDDNDSAEGYGFWDADDDKSSPATPPSSCYDSSSSASTMPASPMGTPPRTAVEAERLPPRPPLSKTNSCPSLHERSQNSGRKLWRNELCGDYTIRESEEDGSFVLSTAGRV